MSLNKNDDIEFFFGNETEYDSTKHGKSIVFAVDTKQLILDSLRFIPKNVSELFNDAGYLKSVSWSQILSKPTTLAGYGITDAQKAVYDYVSVSGTASSTVLPTILAPNETGDGENFKFYDTKYYGSLSNTANRTQVAYGYGKDAIHFRRYYGGAWNAWKEVAFKDWVNTAIGEINAVKNLRYLPQNSDSVRDANMALESGNYFVDPNDLNVPFSGYGSLSMFNSKFNDTWFQIAVNFTGEVKQWFRSGNIRDGAMSTIKDWVEVLASNNYTNYVYPKSTIDSKLSSIPSTNIVNGTGNVAGTIDPISLPLVGSLSSNKLFGTPPENITIEYSTDGGMTWVDYGANETQKFRLFGEQLDVPNLMLGGADSPIVSSNNQLRITIVPNGYYTINKLFFWVANRMGQLKCKMERHSYDGNWYELFADKSLSGWSGANIINFNNTILHSNPTASHQYGIIRLTFTQSGTGTYNSLIFNIRAFGDALYSLDVENNIVRTNRLYTIDQHLNGIFPKGVLPTTTKTQELGNSSLRWGYIYGDVGNFSGNLTVKGINRLYNDIILDYTGNVKNPQIKAISLATSLEIPLLGCDPTGQTNNVFIGDSTGLYSTDYDIHMYANSLIAHCNLQVTELATFNAIKIGDAMITYDSVNGGLKIDKGLYSESYVSAKGADTDTNTIAELQARITELEERINSLTN